MTYPNHNPRIPEGINTSQENPLKEFFALLTGVIGLIVLALIILSFFAQNLSKYIPFHYEEKLTSIYEKRLTDLNEIPTKAQHEELMIEAEMAIKELGTRLAKQMNIDKEINLHFHLIDQPKVPNAFATLGGHIFVTTGLLKEVSSENGLAMVIAHEIAHVKMRHPIQALSRGVVIQVVLNLVFGSQDSQALNGVLGQTGLLTILSFNRDMEHEADAEAVNALESLYGHVGGADEFFIKMAEAGHSSGWKEVFETHPDISRRIKKIRNNGTTTDTILQPPDMRIINYLNFTQAENP